ncbi:MAG: hypothetical protein HOP19_09730 [Acidobacteria bacterium]|nr:hypothetical protein [Acidobacteriota bacterium]
MTNKAKVASAIVAVILLFVTAVVGGYAYWLRQNKPSLQAKQAEGLAFGKTTDDNGCWQEAVKRQKDAKDFATTLQNNSFMLACLAAAKNPPNFCDEVPLPGEMITSIAWSTERCSKLDLSKSDCQGLLRTLQTYCSEYYKK